MNHNRSHQQNHIPLYPSESGSGGSGSLVLPWSLGEPVPYQWHAPSGETLAWKMEHRSIIQGHPAGLSIGYVWFLYTPKQSQWLLQLYKHCPHWFIKWFGFSVTLPFPTALRLRRAKTVLDVLWYFKSHHWFKNYGNFADWVDFASGRVYQ